MNILIVVDMQRDFVDGVLGTPEAEAIVPAVVEKIREYAGRGDVIIATRDTHEQCYMDTQEGKNLPVVHCVRDTTGWELVPAVAAALPEDAVILDKPAFGSTDLMKLMGKYVREAGEENVHAELVGLCTDVCVVSNALMLKSIYREMPLSLDASCCAGVTAAKHSAALETMRSCQIQVVNG